MVKKPVILHTVMNMEVYKTDKQTGGQTNIDLLKNTGPFVLLRGGMVHGLGYYYLVKNLVEYMLYYIKGW